MTNEQIFDILTAGVDFNSINHIPEEQQLYLGKGTYIVSGSIELNPEQAEQNRSTLNHLLKEIEERNN